MPKFKYVAKDKDAHLISGVMEAADNLSVVKELRNREFTIISITEDKTESKTAMRIVIGGGRRIRAMDLVVFSRQLATFIDAGIPLVMGLNLLHEQIDNVKLKKIINEIRNDLEAGNSLSSAFAKHNEFPPIFANMVKAGETSGGLNEILDRLAEYLEKVESLRRKLRTASIYPIAVTAMAVIINIFLMIRVVPTFKSIFESLNVDLPLPTLILIRTSDFIVQAFPFIVVSLVVTVILLIRYINTPNGRLLFDRFKLRLPILGPVANKIATARFTRTLATLVRSGVGILDAFDISGKVAGNRVIELAAEQIRVNIKAGENISGPMGETGKFPNFVVKMIAVGEETWELEKMLSKISDDYDEQVDATITSLTSSIEPLIIVFLGVTIGFIVVAMFMPIFKLTTLVGQM